MSAPYTMYFKALELGGGRQLTREQAQSLGLTTEPCAGFWRKRDKSGPDVAVAIWNSEQGMVAIAGRRPAHPDEIWTWCCTWPVPEDWYRAVESGGAWPDDAPAPKDHNLVKTGDPHADLSAELAAERETAEDLLRKPIASDQQADSVAVWSKRVAEIVKKAENHHKVEKAPILEAGRAVDNKWRDLREGGDALVKSLKRHLDPWLRAKERAEQERQRQAKAEAERIRREAEEAERRAAEIAAKAEAGNGIASEMERKANEEADRLAEQAKAAEREAQPQKVSAGRTGMKVSPRTFVEAEITDYDALLAALKDRTEIKEVVQALANRAAKSGVDLPGMKIVEDRRAA